MFSAINWWQLVSWAIGAGALTWCGVLHWLLRRVKERAFNYALTLFETKRLVERDADSARLLDASESILRDLLRADEAHLADQPEEGAPREQREIELARLAARMARAMHDELGSRGCGGCARAMKAATAVSAKNVE